MPEVLVNFLHGLLNDLYECQTGSRYDGLIISERFFVEGKNPV